MNNLSSSKVYSGILRGINNMPEKEFLKQEGYYDLLRNIATSMLRSGEKIYVYCCSKNNNETGCTNGEDIFINTWSPLVLSVEKLSGYLDKGVENSWNAQLPKKCVNRQMMYLSNVGTVVHEFGHIMYTDFKNLSNIREKLYNGDFTGCAKKEKLEQLYDTGFKKALSEMMLDITNILEDAYIENAIALDYPPNGNAVRGLEACNTIKFFTSSPLPKLEKKIEKGKMLFADAFTWLLQLDCCLGYTPKDIEKCHGEVHDILMNALNEARPIARDYKISSKKHAEDIYKIMDIVADLLPDPEVIKQLEQMMKNNPSGGGNGSDSDNSNQQNSGSQSSRGSSNNQSNSSSNQSSGSQEENQGQQNDSDSSSNSSQQTSSNSQSSTSQQSSNNSEQEENSHSNSNGNDLINGQRSTEETDESRAENKKDASMSEEQDLTKGTGKAKRNIKSDEDLQKAVDEIKKQLKQEEGNSAEADLRKLIKELAGNVEAGNQEKELKESLSKVEGYFPRSSYSIRSTESASISPNKYEYDRCYDRIKQTAKKCTRQISQILKKRNYSDTLNGQLCGSRFNSNETYRNDGRYFSKRIIPDNIPDCVFTIMVDESGSMGGEKIKIARQTAILFDTISRDLDIPTRIVGHTTSVNKVQVFNYRNFKSIDKEKYTLGSISANSGNIDTMVLSGLCEEILKRPEKSKVVIVISDGAPCGDSYNSSVKDFKGIPFKKLNSENNLIANDIDNQHLNACVRYYRKKGVKVIGVAIDDGESIKAIYEDGTLDCTKLEKLPTEMVKLFKCYVLK